MNRSPSQCKLYTKTFTGIIGLAMGWLAAGLVWPSFSEAQVKKKVTVQLDWVVSGFHTGFFVAKEKGLYGAKGLDVTINRGFGSGDTAKVVGAGKSEFGVVTIPVIITSRGKGVPLVAVAVLYGKAPESFVSFEEKAIRHPKDVEGKSFAEAAGAATIVTWPAFAKLVGIDINKVTFIPVEAATKPAVFFAGRVDFIFGWRVGSDAILIVQAKKERKRLVFVPWGDYGWRTYGTGIAINEKVLREDPKLADDFISATFDGFRWSMENAEPALDILVRANPEIDRAAAHLNLKFAIDGLLSNAAREQGLGYMEPDRMAFQIDLMSKFLNFRPPKAEELYTNRFIQKKPFTVSPALQAELEEIR